jgi:hypothetical protein
MNLMKQKTKLIITRVDAIDLDAANVHIGLHKDFDRRLRYFLVVECDADAVVARQLGLVAHLQHLVGLLVNLVRDIRISWICYRYAHITCNMNQKNFY